jgi:hypothetical protein
LKFAYGSTATGNDDNIVESGHLCAPLIRSCFPIIDARRGKKLKSTRTTHPLCEFLEVRDADEGGIKILAPDKF